MILKKFKRIFSVLVFSSHLLMAWVVLIATHSPLSSAGHGQGFNASLKYPPNFTHFDWASPQSKPGGELRIGLQIPFDTLNPFILKGNSPGILSDFVFETLTMRSLDEPFAQYGMLAKDIEVHPDGLGITYRLHPNAKFSDGKPVTAQDVKATFELLISASALPNYAAYYSDVKEVKAVDQHTVTFLFKQKNPELHMILGELPVLPRHLYTQKSFGTDFTNKAVGSGPYTIGQFAPGKIIELVKNPNYWGKDLTVNKHRFNYDKIVGKFFRDSSIWLEGLKANDIDFAFLASSKQWATDIQGEKWDKQWLAKKNLPHQMVQGMQGFVMNLRRPLFQNRAVRKALAYALDFEWANKTLFYNQYVQHQSYFDNSELAAKGLPSAAELALLEAWRGKIPSEVFTEAPAAIGVGMDSRARLTAAKKILDADGWKIQDGVLTKSGQKLSFTIILEGQMWERVCEPYINNLKRLGIDAKMKMTDTSIYLEKSKNFDFDMLVGGFGQSNSPGNEQRMFWHSSSAKEPGGYNTIGLADPAIDALVKAVIEAPDRTKLVTAVRALDRVLWFGYYVVPHWYISSYRITFWNNFRLPKTLPAYYDPFSYFMEYSWWDKKADAELKSKMKSNQAFNPALK
jgi:microcin C transport system substrate-binding protein